MGRRVCPQCNKNYNVADINTPDGYVMAPLLPKKDHSKCDDCGNVKLVVRDDDKESIIRDRLQLYKDKTEPIIEFYKKQPHTKVIDYEAKKGVNDYPELKRLLKESLNI